MIINDKDKDLNRSSNQEIKNDAIPEKASSSHQQSVNDEQPNSTVNNADDKDDEGWVAVGSGLGINE